MPVNEAPSQTLTYDQYVERMIQVAKEIQGENFVGELFYRVHCSWESYYEDRVDPREAVLSDMSYWE